MFNIKLRIYFTLLFSLWATTAHSQYVSLEGQLSGWTTINAEQSPTTLLGLRYIPVMTATKRMAKTYSIDAELSFHAYGSSQIRSLDHAATQGKIKPYRMWLRFSGSRFEVRLGLQKINFGSATLLRPLMWFDRIDPRDPLQLTDGVYAILGRYYFLNNANIWLWGLYGNAEAKGWEFIPSHRHKAEYGGRLQLPLLAGEIAVSYHHRQLDLRKQVLAPLLSSENIVAENRVGLDGKWDVGIGLWFETAVVHQDVELRSVQYQRFINWGADYTFNLGNGLHVMTEFFNYRTSDKIFGSGRGGSFSALSGNYPLSLLDNLTAMIYYDWENHDWYRFINWQRKYDNWSFYFIGFWNPAQFQVYRNTRDTNLFAGKGIQLMVVFNH